MRGSAITVETENADATRRLGESIGRAAAPTLLVLLTGPLGAGKTTFVQGLARGLGVSGRVTSPTFTLVHEHQRAGQDEPVLVHVDLYRLAAADAADLGLDEIFARATVSAVEWPDRAAAEMPEDALRVDLSLNVSARAAGEDGWARRITLEAGGPVSRQVLERVRSELARSPMPEDGHP